MRISGRFVQKRAKNDEIRPLSEPDSVLKPKGFELPRRLGDARKLALVSHVAEANTRNTELCEESTWTTIDCVTAANANW
jgi:hypothetical protein